MPPFKLAIFKSTIFCPFSDIISNKPLANPVQLLISNTSKDLQCTIIFSTI